jgi:general secretion pathway protein K
MKPPPPREQGMILINVLLFVAIAAGIVALMLTAEDVALERAIRMQDAVRAQAIAYGGEASAVTALRRDAQAGPSTDDPTEAWNRLGATSIAIEGGRFELVIADAQGRFNINNLMNGDVAPARTLDRITAFLGLKPELAIALTEYVRLNGPIADLSPLAAAGLDTRTRARLVALVTALPVATPVNANSASETLLALVLGDEETARALIARRSRNGFLTEEDLADSDALSDESLDVRSSYFWVRTRVVAGDARQQLLSLIGRRFEAGRPARVAVVARWWGAGGPPEAPQLP